MAEKRYFGSKVDRLCVGDVSFRDLRFILELYSQHCAGANGEQNAVNGP